MTIGLRGSHKLGRLSDRQRSVLLLLCKGLRNSEIAKSLGTSERSVKGYIAQLFLIFDVSNRTELAAVAVVELKGSDVPILRLDDSKLRN